MAKEVNITNSLNSATISMKIMTETISSFQSLYDYEWGEGGGAKNVTFL